MVQCDATVTDASQIGPFRRVRLDAPRVAAGLSAGRFTLADLGDYLRTPLFPAQLEQTCFEILVAPDHPAAHLRSGTQVNLIGPLGRGYEVPDGARHLLLVADLPHLPVLLPLTHQEPGTPENQSVSIALLLSATDARGFYPIHLLPPSLEVQIATADGSIGHAGPVLDLLPDMVRWADSICIAADAETYPSMADAVREASLLPARRGGRRRFAQALVVPPMPCGVGACRGCSVSTHHAPGLACTDGPVFNLLELL